MVGKAKEISRFKHHIMEKLQAQHFYTASASLPSVVASSSHIGGDEETPDFNANIETRGMGNAPSSQ